MGADLKTTYMGIPIKNPIILSAGPTTATPEICEKAAKVGHWAGVVTKTNYPEEVLKKVPLTIPRPYYALMDARGVTKWKPVIPKKKGSRNRFGRLGEIQPDYCLTMATIRYPAPFEKRTGIGVYFQGAERYTYYVNRTKELIKETGCKVIASITAFTEQGWEEQVKIVNSCKADMVELNFGCPTIGTLDEEATGGEWITGTAMGFYPTIVNKWTKYCTERIKIPVAAKLPPYAPFQSAQAAVRNGAKGIQWGDAPVFLPEMHPLAIDVETGTPGTFPGLPFSGVFGASGVIPYICGAIAYFRVNGIKVDISGCGGVREALDIVRILMAGATSVQVCTATLVNGVEVGAHYLNEITSWMEKKEYRSIEEVIGIAATAETLGLDLSKAPTVALPQIIGGPIPLQKIEVIEKKCIACGWCERACFHLAIEVREGLPTVNDKLCEVCGMCVAVCPMEALKMVLRN